MSEPAPASAPRHLWMVVALVCIGAFVGQVDATIVQLALPTLGRVFDAPLQHISWVALAYLLAFVSFLPIFGRLCEMLGRKALYLVVIEMRTVNQVKPVVNRKVVEHPLHRPLLGEGQAIGYFLQLFCHMQVKGNLLRALFKRENDIAQVDGTERVYAETEAGAGIVLHDIPRGVQQAQVVIEAC